MLVALELVSDFLLLVVTAGEDVFLVPTDTLFEALAPTTLLEETLPAFLAVPSGLTGPEVALGNGFVIGGGDFTPCIKDPLPLCAAIYVRLIDVHIKMTATTAVTLPKKGVGPELPNMASLEPNTAPISAPLPCCSNTVTTNIKQASMCMIMRKVYIIPA